MKPKVTIVNSVLAVSRKIADFSAPLRQLVTAKHLAPASLATILGLGGVTWVVESAIAPSVAQAYTARVDISLNSQQGESFSTFLNRAEVVARAAAQRLFDRDILVTDVAVTILGQHEGQIAPVLELEVSRQAWRNIPEATRWATYFPNAKLLLDFRETANTAASEVRERQARPVTRPVEVEISPRPTRPTPPNLIRETVPDTPAGTFPETGIEDTDTVRDEIEPEEAEIVEDELGTEEEEVVETEEELEREEFERVEDEPETIDPNEDVLQNQDLLEDENL